MRRTAGEGPPGSKDGMGMWRPVQRSGPKTGRRTGASGLRYEIRSVITVAYNVISSEGRETRIGHIFGAITVRQKAEKRVDRRRRLSGGDAGANGTLSSAVAADRPGRSAGKLFSVKSLRAHQLRNKLLFVVAYLCVYPGTKTRVSCYRITSYDITKVCDIVAYLCGVVAGPRARPAFAKGAAGEAGILRPAHDAPRRAPWRPGRIRPADSSMTEGVE